MKSESEILERYRELGQYLTGVDAGKCKNSDSQEIYDTCCREFEVLHWVLDLPGEPHWRT
jgi:hypothetical protein